MKIISLVFLLFPCALSAQNFGYFKKKNVLSINLNGAIPLIYNNFSRAKSFSYASKNGELVNSRSYLNYGCRLGLTHFFTGKFGVGFEVNLDKGKITGPKDLYYPVKITNPFYYGNIPFNIQHERINIRTISFLPKIEFNQKYGELPLGISYEFGIGISFTNALDDDYLLDVKPNYNYSMSYYTTAQKGVAELDLKPYRKSLIGLTMLYGINFKTPISRNILISYGLRYTLNPTFSHHIAGSDLEKQYMNEIEGQVVNKRALSIITVNIGINYIF